MRRFLQLTGVFVFLVGILGVVGFYLICTEQLYTDQVFNKIVIFIANTFPLFGLYMIRREQYHSLHYKIRL